MTTQELFEKTREQFNELIEYYRKLCDRHWAEINATTERAVRAEAHMTRLRCELEDMTAERDRLRRELDFIASRQ